MYWSSFDFRTRCNPLPTSHFDWKVGGDNTNIAWSDGNN